MAEMEHTGAMIALIPTPDDAARLAVPGHGEDAEQLHCTLLYLGDADTISAEERRLFTQAAIEAATEFNAFAAEGFAIDVFNPNSDESCIVLGLGGDSLEKLRSRLLAAMTVIVPDQKMPWIPHITLRYTDDMDSVEQFGYAAKLTDRIGMVTFDRIRVAFGGETTDIPLNMAAEPQPLTAAVNTRGWQKLPIADRETKFAFRAAVDRLAAKANSIEEFSSWFFWRDPRKPANNRNSYRMPFADVFEDGTVKLVPSAVFSAAAQLAGAHGALPIIPDAEKEQIRRVIDRIYDQFRDMWEDPRQVPPWQRDDSKAGGEPVKETETATIGGEEGEMPIELVDDDLDYNLTAAVNSSGWSNYPIADMSRPWDSGAARQRIKAWSGGDMAKFRKAFLYYDPANAENLTAYKFPIADIIDGTLTIIPRAVNNADARLSSADIPAADKTRIQGILNRIEERFRGDDSEEDDDSDDSARTAALTAAAPMRAPSAWFEDPRLPGPTRTRVEDNGRVYGHIAQWNTCHRGVGNSCVLAPRSITNYSHFKTGTTLTADGVLLPVGVLTYGGPHADLSLSAVAAAGHYDDAGTGMAVVNVGEDAFGIWFAGTMIAGAGEVEAQRMRAHPLSGDWRLAGGNLELVAALAVNTPGFPISERATALQASAFFADGVQTALVSAGMVLEDGEPVTVDSDEAALRDRVSALEDKASGLMARMAERRAREIMDKNFK